MASSAHHGRWIRQEAAMAAIAIKIMHQNEHVRKQPEKVAAPADAPTTVAPFRPLDPDVVNETIPAFFIGRNKQGFWVARDVNGRIGGIFLFESSAVSFARTNSGAAGCATVYLSEPFELDLENRGNPLVPQCASLIRLAKGPRARLAALIGRMTEPVKRWMRDF
jgi:hypothetical protein